MDTGERRTRPAGRTFDTGLGSVFVLGIVFTAYMFMTSWGGVSWMFGSAVSVAVSGLALLRARWKPLPVCAGLVVTSTAVVVSTTAGDDLPQEPAPVTALALAVLVGSALRTLPRGPAAGIAVGATVLTGIIWSEGLSGVSLLATTGMVAALVTGPVLRGLDRDRRTDRAPRGARADESRP
ncbi:metal transporter [Streptomyces uncialis]|uniref:metal transporter n=1 Tax=Streptomyces uncialis TaxID=1048205 RepID=UPI003800577C